MYCSFSRSARSAQLSTFIVQGRTFVKELDRVLGIADEAQQGKILKQYQEWDANVHGAIQVQMQRRKHNVRLFRAIYSRHTNIQSSTFV